MASCELSVMNWGFILLQNGKAPRRVTNVRDDKILESSFWRNSFEQRRCLVPASSYCEPKGEKPATWHWFTMIGEEERLLFCFPGVWTRYKGPIRKDGPNVDQEVFSFLTTAPNELTASINHDRMPVLMNEESWTGDRMDFRVRALGQVASGLVDVADDHIRLEVTLPWFLKRFADGVEKAIRSRGRLLLGGHSSGSGSV